ncbi:MAG: hypothetical protein WAO41_06300 [Candidatus Nanopelagicales bacterium]
MKQFATVFASLFERETPDDYLSEPPAGPWQFADRPWQRSR